MRRIDSLERHALERDIQDLEQDIMILEDLLFIGEKSNKEIKEIKEELKLAKTKKTKLENYLKEGDNK